MLDRVARLLRQWPDNRRRAFPDPYRSPDRYVLAIPQAVEAEIFPLLYECTNPECRRVVSYRDVKQISKSNPELRCRKCGSSLIQLHHVLIHQCGHIQPFIVPRCPQHGSEHIWLDTRGSQKYAQFRWRCRLCGFQQPLIYGNCPDCSLPDRTMRPLVHRASASFYPQYLTLINLPGRELTRILQDPERHWLAIAAYLRLLDLGPDTRLVDLTVSPQGRTQKQESIATLQRFIQNAPDASKPELQKQLDALQRSLAGLGGDRRGQLIAQARELVPLDDNALEEAGRELLEFVHIDESLQITTLAQLEQKAQQEMPARLPVYQTAYQEALQETGLADVRLIGDFPVTTVVIGYTRDQREADNTILRAFSRLQQDDPRTPLFVDTVETEALCFVLTRLEFCAGWLSTDWHRASCRNTTMKRLSGPGFSTA